MSATLFGNQITGEELRNSNINAIGAVANILRTTLGPCGYEKMIVDDIGEVTITNDGATILQQLELDHPAAKMVVDLAKNQDTEVGDGTTTVVLLAYEIIKRGLNLISMGVHQTSIIQGYKIAMRECSKYISNHLSRRLPEDDSRILVNMAQTALSSKTIGSCTMHFAELLVTAIKRTSRIDCMGDVRYPIKFVNIHTVHGKSISESYLCDSFLLEATRGDEQMALNINNVKIALLNFGLKQYRLQMGISIECTDPEKLEEIRKEEREIAKRRVKRIIDAGANCIITTQGIDDLIMKYISSLGAIGIRRVELATLKTLAYCSGGKIIKTLIGDDDSEMFSSDYLGECESVCEKIIGDRHFMSFSGLKFREPASIVIRGPNEFVTEEARRSVHDGLCVLSKALEQRSVSPGAGCTEVSLGLHLEEFGTTIDSVEQLPILEFAQAMLALPTAICNNSNLDPDEIIAQLRTRIAQDKEWYGIDLQSGGIFDVYEHGILEPTVVKVKALKMAVEAANTIIRIDDSIWLNPQPEEPDQ